MFTEDEYKQLMLAIISGVGDGREGATTEEIFRFVEWAEEMVSGYHLVKMVLAGKLLVGLPTTEDKDPTNYVFKDAQ